MALGNCDAMVKFQCRISKKRYLNSKRVYKYERLSLDIPKKHHKLLGVLLDRDFDLAVKVEDKTVTITLVSKEIPCQREPTQNVLDKGGSEPLSSSLGNSRRNSHVLSSDNTYTPNRLP